MVQTFAVKENFLSKISAYDQTNTSLEKYTYFSVTVVFSFCCLCRHQKLQFRPPLEEIRAKYYREMRKFISIPNHFRGVGDDNSIFPIMIDQNSAGFITVYKKAEDLFQRLVDVQDQFKDWVVLGTVDLEKLIDTHLQTVPDWERNFRAIKAKGREAEKLPL